MKKFDQKKTVFDSWSRLIKKQKILAVNFEKYQKNNVLKLKQRSLYVIKVHFDKIYHYSESDKNSLRRVMTERWETLLLKSDNKGSFPYGQKGIVIQSS